MLHLAQELQRQPDRETTLQAIVKAVVNTVPGAEWAGVSLVRGRKVTAEVPTDEIVRLLDECQSELNEGPCLSAIREHRSVNVPDLAAPDVDWPRFAAEAVRLGVRSLLSFQLFVQRETLGALNLYGPEPHAFVEDSVVIGDLFAQHAAVALAGATQEMRLGEALRTRDLIGQAKGILMLRDGLDEHQAFARLVQASQHANLKLVDAAQWLIAEVSPEKAR
ncbi:response regulator receiver protein [Actinophytocola xanthii]|uniref:Response regulator receiver protein n=2 Tax=Actinophytocola xanthii TaxID=1912961 RepID=A0A1Q8CSC3_9PSEU|nr:response regulator receiver protein [Actinophytocola xanthii]